MIPSLIFERELTRLLGSKAIRVSTGTVVVFMFTGEAVDRYFFRKNGIDTTPLEVARNGTGGNPFGFAMGSLGNSLPVVTPLTGIDVLGVGVVGEKAGRMMEILLTAVKLRILLLGKVLGIDAGMLAVLTAYMMGIVGGLGLAGLLPDPGTFGKLGVWTSLSTFLTWIVVGYLTASGLTGALASTISRQEDLGGAQAPIILGLTMPMYTAIYYIPTQSGSTASEVISFISSAPPPIMIMWTVLGGVSAWQQLAAFAVNIAFIPPLAALTGKIYESSILRTGERVKVVKALRGSNWTCETRTEMGECKPSRSS